MAEGGASGPSRVRRDLAAFVGVGLVVMLVILLGSVFVIGQVAQRQALAEDETTTENLAKYVVAPVLGDVLDGESEERRHLDRLMDLRIQDGSITEVNVWAADGRILYSDDRESVGRRFEPPAEVLTAIRDGVSTSVVETEPETGPGPEPRQVEVYVPLLLADRVLAFEVYYSYRTVQEQTEQLAALIVPLVVGAVLILQLVQVPIAVSLARRVRRHETDRARLLAEALSASDRERREIAADIHDGVVQDLAGVGYALGALSRCVPAEHREMAERVGATVRTTVDRLRRLMVDIYPPDLSGPGLAVAVSDLTARLRQAGLRVEVRVEPMPSMDPEVAATVYRTAREAFTNVVKHAAAHAVDVQLGPDEDTRCPDRGWVRLRVTDDGRGLDTRWRERRALGHLGLRMLADRLADMGGELVVAPGPTGGTVVEARLPARTTPATADPPDRGDGRPPSGGSSSAGRSRNLGPDTPTARTTMPAAIPTPRPPTTDRDTRPRTRLSRVGWTGTAIVAGLAVMSGWSLPAPAGGSPDSPASVTSLQDPDAGAGALPSVTVPGVPNPDGPAVDVLAPTDGAALVVPGSTATGLDAGAGSRGIPAPVLAAYRAAADSVGVSDPGCGLSWELVGAIGSVESGHARGGRVDPTGTTTSPILGPVLDGGPGIMAIRDTDRGRLDGDVSWDRAVGPMQFIPSTWRSHAADGNRDGRGDPHNVVDAALAAGRYLCAGDADLRTAGGAAAAVFRYNRSAVYVRKVLGLAAAYAGGVVPVPTATGPESSPAATRAPRQPSSPRALRQQSPPQAALPQAALPLAAAPQDAPVPPHSVAPPAVVVAPESGPSEPAPKQLAEGGPETSPTPSSTPTPKPSPQPTATPTPAPASTTPTATPTPTTSPSTTTTTTTTTTETTPSCAPPNPDGSPAASTSPAPCDTTGPGP